jgi:hypothetical protein
VGLGGLAVGLGVGLAVGLADGGTTGGLVADAAAAADVRPSGCAGSPATAPTTTRNARIAAATVHLGWRAGQDRSGTQTAHPAGGAGHDGSGSHRGGGVQPAGGCGQDGGGLYRHRPSGRAYGLPTESPQRSLGPVRTRGG